MSLDWCPGIREACGHWRDAPMLQQTFEALERTMEQDNDACIDCSKTVVAPRSPDTEKEIQEEKTGILIFSAPRGKNSGVKFCTQVH